MSELIGIDFGTTNSLAAFMDGGRPTLIPNRRGSRTTPSVVALSPKGEFLVGESAKNQALVNPADTVLAVKRRLGSPEPLELGGRRYRPQEIAALILGSLKADAERHLGREVGRAVLSAPAHFSDPERRALLEAGRLAGLEIIRILNEPTAAALARAWELGLGGQEGRGSGPAEGALKRGSPAALEDRLILVYDFGGGTFDVTVLSQRGEECAVLASLGDGRLGGLDLDRELFELASRSFRAEYGIEAEADRLLAQQLSEQAERAKIELSELEESAIALPFALRGDGGGMVHPLRRLGREEFEAIALPYVERSLELTSKALKAAGVSSADIDGLVLSGGSSRIPLVSRLLFERFGLRPEGGINPEEIVALGAAVAGGLGRGEAGGRAEVGLRFRDVVARSYGVEIDGGRFIPLIKKNSPIPARQARSFTTVADGQDLVEIHVLQGESPRAAENLSLGRFLLSGIRRARAGIPRISVEFGIDESDILHVSARDLDTGQSQAISIADFDRGAADQGPEDILGKLGLLAERIGELGAGLSLESSLAAELESAVGRARAASPELGAGELRILKAELEGLVGELLARRSSARLAERREGR